MSLIVESGATVKETQELARHSTPLTCPRRPDLWMIIDRCLGRVGRLVEQRAKVEEVRDIERRLSELTDKMEGNLT